jgi:hypothetical protein
MADEMIGNSPTNTPLIELHYENMMAIHRRYETIVGRMHSMAMRFTGPAPKGITEVAQEAEPGGHEARFVHIREEFDRQFEELCRLMDELERYV